MLPFSGRGILLDIEGTTSSVSYVYDVMFPFARKHLEAYLRSHWGEAKLAAACELMARDAGHDSLAKWLTTTDPARELEIVRAEAERLMSTDAKTTGLKELQGLIWENGFRTGELRAQVFDDVPPALRAWHAAGLDVRIYSSGSVHAQRLFFGHTEQGNLLPLFRGHYDTTTGPKRSAESYTAIAAAFALPPSELLFLSDVVAELDAARTAGLQTGLVLRPGNAAVAAEHGHAEIHSFAEIALSGERSRSAN